MLYEHFCKVHFPVSVTSKGELTEIILISILVLFEWQVDAIVARLEVPSSCLLMIVVAARLHGRRHRRDHRRRLRRHVRDHLGRRLG